MKRRMTFLILLLGLTISACSCVFWGIRGNGKLRTETRKITYFTKLDVSGAYRLNIRYDKDISLKITAEENLLPYIKTHIEGEWLKIYNTKNLSPRKEIVIDISANEITELISSGANNVKINDINTDDFVVSVSGAGSIKLEGECDNLTADISGAGNLDAEDLKALDVLVSVSGVGCAEVCAYDFLRANVSGVGSINYYGNPKKTKTNISGVGTIRRK